MSTDNPIHEIVDNYIRHAQSDYVGLWQIVGRVRDEFSLRDNRDVQEKTLTVVTDLIGSGVRPGDYLKTGFHFWEESDTASIINRIKREWDIKKGDPTLAAPICWFDMKAR